MSHEKTEQTEESPFIISRRHGSYQIRLNPEVFGEDDDLLILADAESLKALRNQINKILGDTES